MNDIIYTVLAPGTIPAVTSVSPPTVTADAGCTLTKKLEIDITGTGVWEDYESTSFTQVWINNFNATTTTFDIETSENELSGLTFKLRYAYSDDAIDQETIYEHFMVDFEYECDEIDVFAPFEWYDGSTEITQFDYVINSGLYYL